MQQPQWTAAEAAEAADGEAQQPNMGAQAWNRAAQGLIVTAEILLSYGGRIAEVAAPSVRYAVDGGGRLWSAAWNVYQDRQRGQEPVVEEKEQEAVEEEASPRRRQF